MHELIIAGNIVDIVVNEARERIVTAVNIVVGDLLSVAEEPINTCFQIAASGTPAEGALLSLIRVPAVVKCKRCGSEFGLQGSGACPACGGCNSEVIRGRECYVDSIEVKDE